MIDFSLTDELRDLQDRTRAFIRDEIMPFEGDTRETPHGPTDDLRQELLAKARAAGPFASRARPRRRAGGPEGQFAAWECIGRSAPGHGIESP